MRWVGYTKNLTETNFVTYAGFSAYLTYPGIERHRRRQPRAKVSSKTLGISLQLQSIYGI